MFPTPDGVARSPVGASLGRAVFYDGSEKTVFHTNFLETLRVTPSLPKEGEAAQGEHPLDPLSSTDFSTNSITSLSLRGDTIAGGT
jgi:hypothetical protein